ncbi:hypothetical protein [Simplicispira metamorpha]|uniref:Uncharacterized protein n=1 Tax=Simplicispira metamorpha TaxID=80881 RepID=A0A4R2MYD8_9BURK|nr:hypothetical protein [Simplicispira metamorpha]TCP10795.1 hypothetical protein EV674_1552 [Simplicispira metamorpha]
MSAPHKSIPHDNAFDVLRKSHGVILTERETAHISTALQGIHTIAAILQQRELDAELEDDSTLSFGPSVAQGLISALATCAKYAEGIVDTGGIAGQCAIHDTPAYAELEAARWRVLEANRKGATP